MTPASPWGDKRGQLSHQLKMRNQALARRRARRLCQNFERVGVRTAPERLQQVLSGAPLADHEATDINFAFIAVQFNRNARATRYKRLKRYGTRSLIFAGLVLIVLNFLVCLAYALLNLAQQATPM